MKILCSIFCSLSLSHIYRFFVRTSKKRANTKLEKLRTSYMHRTWGINEARDDKIFPPQSNHQCLARHEFCLPQRGNKERTKLACLILSHPTPAQMCVCTRIINLQNTHFLLVLFLELPIPLLSHLSYSHKCWGHFMGMARCLRRAPPKPTLPCASFPYPKMKARRPWSNQCLTILNAQPNVDMDAMIVVLGDLGKFR